MTLPQTDLRKNKLLSYQLKAKIGLTDMKALIQKEQGHKEITETN